MIGRTTRSSAIPRDAATLDGGRGVGEIRPEAPAANAPGLCALWVRRRLLRERIEAAIQSAKGKAMGKGKSKGKGGGKGKGKGC